MRVSLYNGSTLYPLAGQAGVNERVHSSSGDFRETARAETQIVNRVRATYAEPLDRGNLLTQFQFSTTRIFDTPALAELWCLDYEAAFPRDGTLIMDAIAPGGVVTRRHLLNAVVSPPSRRCIGCTVQLDYQVEGGQVQAGGTKASGTFTFTGFPAATQTIAVGSRTWTYKTTGPFLETDLAHPAMIAFSETIEAYAAQLAEAINNWTESPVTALAAAGVVTVTAKIPGTAGNAITLAETADNAAKSGATLSGGVE